MESKKSSKEDMHGIKQKHMDIYKRYAQQYDQFKAKQDCNNQLITKLLEIVALSNVNTKVSFILNNLGLD
jgi:hypothetical protein